MKLKNQNAIKNAMKGSTNTTSVEGTNNANIKNEQIT